MNQKPTALQWRLAKSETLKSDVMALCEMTDFEYCNFKYTEGLRYLEAYIMPEETENKLDREFKDTVIDTLERSRIFWNWWKNHWTLRDEEYVALLDGVISDLYSRRKMYFDFNNGHALASKVRPHKVVLDATYAEMIDRVMAAEKSK